MQENSCKRKKGIYHTREGRRNFFVLHTFLPRSLTSEKETIFPLCSMNRGSKWPKRVHLVVLALTTIVYVHICPLKEDMPLQKEKDKPAQEKRVDYNKK